MTVLFSPLPSCCFFFYKFTNYGKGREKKSLLLQVTEVAFFVVVSWAALTVLFLLPVLSPPVLRWFPLTSGAPQSYLSRGLFFASAGWHRSEALLLSRTPNFR